MQFAAAAVSAYGSIYSARAQQSMYNAQAAQEKIAGRSRAIGYKQQAADALANMNQTLAAVVARAAVGGDPTSGSPLAVQKYALREGVTEYHTAKDNAVLAVENANYQANLYRQAGRTAMVSGYINAAGSLAMGAAQQNQVGWPKWTSSQQVAPAMGGTIE